MFIAAIFAIVKIRNHLSDHQWKNGSRRCDAYIHNERLVIKKNEILPFATAWKDLGGIVFSEMSQTEKDEYCMMSLICEILKIKQANIVYITKQRQTHRYREQTSGYQLEEGRDKRGRRLRDTDYE